MLIVTSRLLCVVSVTALTLMAARSSGRKGDSALESFSMAVVSIADSCGREMHIQQVSGEDCAWRQLQTTATHSMNHGSP